MISREATEEAQDRHAAPVLPNALDLEVAARGDVGLRVGQGLAGIGEGAGRCGGGQPRRVGAGLDRDALGGGRAVGTGLDRSPCRKVAALEAIGEEEDCCVGRRRDEKRCEQ